MVELPNMNKNFGLWPPSSWPVAHEGSGWKTAIKNPVSHCYREEGHTQHMIYPPWNQQIAPENSQKNAGPQKGNSSSNHPLSGAFAVSFKVVNPYLKPNWPDFYIRQRVPSPTPPSCPTAKANVARPRGRSPTSMPWTGTRGGPNLGKKDAVDGRVEMFQGTYGCFQK